MITASPTVVLDRLSKSDFQNSFGETPKPNKPKFVGLYHPELYLHDFDRSEWENLLGWSDDLRQYMSGEYESLLSQRKELRRIIGMLIALSDRHGSELITRNPCVNLFKRGMSKADFWMMRLLENEFSKDDLLTEIEIVLDYLSCLEVSFPTLNGDCDCEKSRLHDYQSQKELSPKECYFTGVREALIYGKYLLTQVDFLSGEYMWMDKPQYLKGGYQSWGHRRDELLIDVRIFHHLAPSGYLTYQRVDTPLDCLIRYCFNIRVCLHEYELDDLRSRAENSYYKVNLAKKVRHTVCRHLLRIPASRRQALEGTHRILDSRVPAEDLSVDEIMEVVYAVAKPA